MSGSAPGIERREDAAGELLVDDRLVRALDRAGPMGATTEVDRVADHLQYRAARPR